MNRIVYGGDTETCRGKPMSLQFYSEDVACDVIYFVNEHTAQDVFLKWCASLKNDCEHVVYVHHLEFDIVEFFWKRQARLIGESGSGDFEFRVGRWRISGVFGGPNFCKITDGHHRTIWLIDSMSWYKGSLAKAAKVFCPHLPKLPRITGLGEKLFTKRDAGFVDYAMRDAVIAYHIGKSVNGYQQEFDIPQALSVADMAAKIFRRKFLTYEIPQPNSTIVDAAFASYHGGKNNIACEPGWHEDVSALDISSAYPRRMWELPAFSNAKLYRTFKASAGTRRFPEHGVYCVSGTAKKTPWPVIFTHSFKPLTDCDVTRVWVQGSELNEAIASGEFKCGKARGYFYDAEKDHQAPALRGYVETFYAKKEREKDKALREQHKNMLTNLYGKFIQTRKRGAAEYTDVDTGDTLTASDLVAGGMFHPFIATDITGHTRARIRRMEKEWSAIHTSTDGILTDRKLRYSSRQYHDVLPSQKSARELGRITVEAESTTALIVRTKLYVLYTDAPIKDKTTPSSVFKGKHILKFASHGFQGKVSDLERMMVSGLRKYKIKRANTLKATLNYNATAKAKGRALKVVNNFETHDMKLNVGNLGVIKHARRKASR